MPRILVVEDEPSLAMGLEDDLKLEGYDIEVVGDGEIACERAVAKPFDLIILDVMLPRKDGFEVCRELRRGGLHTPVILLTARAQESDKVLGLDLGADDYVTKPFSPRELRARVKALLRRAAGELPDVYRFGDVELDFTRAELRRGGKPVEITPLEFKLLAALIRHRGCVFSRDKLLDEVWGRGVFITDRVIDTHVTNLRVNSSASRTRIIMFLNDKIYNHRERVCPATSSNAWQRMRLGQPVLPKLEVHHSSS